MVLKHAGAVKRPREFFYQIDDRTLGKMSDHIDATIYRQCKHDYGHFRNQLKYLHDNGLIGPKLREYITLVSDRRNKVHRYRPSISDMERVLFYLAKQLLLAIKLGMCEPMLRDFHDKGNLSL